MAAPPPPPSHPDLPPTLGSTPCAHPSCHTHSFLPHLCACALSFCPTHAFPPAAHACTAAPSASALRDNIALPAERGRFEHKFRDLLPDPERRVDRSVDEAERDERRRRAAEVLARHEEAVAAKARVAAKRKAGDVAEPAASGSQLTAAPKVAGRKALSPAIELARLKGKAKAAEPRRVNVEVGERWYLNVVYREGAEQAERARGEFWLFKGTNCGRALDLFATALRTPNVNGTSDDPTRLLTLCTSTTTPPTPTKNLDRIDKVFPNGGTALIVRGLTVP